MKKFAFSLLVATGLAIAAAGWAGPALAAPAPASAQDTVNSLQAKGDKVILTRVGAAPLSQCTVTAVRPGTPITGLRPTSSGNRQLQQQIRYTTVYVDADCTAPVKAAS